MKTKVDLPDVYAIRFDYSSAFLDCAVTFTDDESPLNLWFSSPTYGHFTVLSPCCGESLTVPGTGPSSTIEDDASLHCASCGERTLFRHWKDRSFYNQVNDRDSFEAWLTQIVGPLEALILAEPLQEELMERAKSLELRLLECNTSDWGEIERMLEAYSYCRDSEEDSP